MGEVARVSKPLSGRSLLQERDPTSRERERICVSKPLSGRSLLQGFDPKEDKFIPLMSPNR